MDIDIIGIHIIFSFGFPRPSSFLDFTSNTKTPTNYSILIIDILVYIY